MWRLAPLNLRGPTWVHTDCHIPLLTVLTITNWTTWTVAAPSWPRSNYALGHKVGSYVYYAAYSQAHVLHEVPGVACRKRHVTDAEWPLATKTVMPQGSHGPIITMASPLIASRGMLS